MTSSINFSGNPSTSSSSSIDRSNVGKVCEEWDKSIQPLPNSNLAVYGKIEWEKYFGYRVEGDVPELPPGLNREVELMSSQLKGVKKAAACSLLLMPRGLTLNMLVELIKKPEKDRKTLVYYIPPNVVEQLGNRAIDKTCWVLFYEGVIEGSEGKTYEEQKALIEKKTDSQCSLPKLIETLTCIAFKRVETGERLFISTPWTFTRCEEEVDGEPLVIGGFSPWGLSINEYDIYDCTRGGAAASRKF